MLYSTYRDCEPMQQPGFKKSWGFSAQGKRSWANNRDYEHQRSDCNAFRSNTIADARKNYSASTSSSTVSSARLSGRYLDDPSGTSSLLVTPPPHSSSFPNHQSGSLHHFNYSPDQLDGATMNNIYLQHGNVNPNSHCIRGSSFIHPESHSLDSFDYQQGFFSFSSFATVPAIPTVEPYSMICGFGTPSTASSNSNGLALHSPFQQSFFLPVIESLSVEELLLMCINENVDDFSKRVAAETLVSRAAAAILSPTDLNKSGCLSEATKSWPTPNTNDLIEISHVLIAQRKCAEETARLQEQLRSLLARLVDLPKQREPFPQFEVTPDRQEGLMTSNTEIRTQQKTAAKPATKTVVGADESLATSTALCAGSPESATTTGRLDCQSTDDSLVTAFDPVLRRSLRSRTLPTELVDWDVLGGSFDRCDPWDRSSHDNESIWNSYDSGDFSMVNCMTDGGSRTRHGSVEDAETDAMGAVRGHITDQRSVSFRLDEMEEDLILNPSTNKADSAIGDTLHRLALETDVQSANSNVVDYSLSGDLLGNVLRTTKNTRRIKARTSPCMSRVEQSLLLRKLIEIIDSGDGIPQKGCRNLANVDEYQTAQNNGDARSATPHFAGNSPRREDSQEFPGILKSKTCDFSALQSVKSSISDFVPKSLQSASSVVSIESHEPSLKIRYHSSDKIMLTSGDVDGDNSGSLTTANKQTHQANCKPCAFFYNKKKGCNNGDACDFCHHNDHANLGLKKWKKQCFLNHPHEASAETGPVVVNIKAAHQTLAVSLQSHGVQRSGKVPAMDGIKRGSSFTIPPPPPSLST